MNGHVQITGSNNETSEQNEYEKLFHENINLIYYMMKFYKKPNDFDYDDWFQVGAIHLWNSCHTFDPQKKFTFATWATACIRNGFLEEYRSRTFNIRKANYNAFSMDVLVTDGEADEKLELNGLLEDKRVNVESIVIANDIKNSLMEAVTIEFRVQINLFLEGYKGTEIAKILGRSQATSSKRIKKIKEKTLMYYEMM